MRLNLPSLSLGHNQSMCFWVSLQTIPNTQALLRILPSPPGASDPLKKSAVLGRDRVDHRCLTTTPFTTCWHQDIGPYQAGSHWGSTTRGGMLFEDILLFKNIALYQHIYQSQVMRRFTKYTNACCVYNIPRSFQLRYLFRELAGCTSPCYILRHFSLAQQLTTT